MKITTYKTELEDGQTILVKENSSNYYCDNNLDNPEKVVLLMNRLFRLNKQAEEYAYVIATNAKCKPIGVFELSHGTATGTFVEPREIFVRLSLIGAVNFFLIHNHPSGDSTPSKDDRDITKRVKEAAQIIGFVFSDHIIIGEATYYSFAKEKCL